MEFLYGDLIAAAFMGGVIGGFFASLVVNFIYKLSAKV